MHSELCPCGSNQTYQHCCGLFHLGQTTAATPEALMRSRYCAYKLGLGDYLFKTWHPDFRGALTAEELSEPQPHWVKLHIFSSSSLGDQGKVHFKAWYRSDNLVGYLEEHSNFLFVEGRWLYSDGQTESGEQKWGRNDPCFCGSNKKFKQCCGK